MWGGINQRRCSGGHLNLLQMMDFLEPEMRMCMISSRCQHFVTNFDSVFLRQSVPLATSPKVISIKIPFVASKCQYILMCTSLNYGEIPVSSSY